MPQFIDSARSSITNILKKELYKKDQIKSALIIHATYIKCKNKGIGNSTDIKNYDTSYYHPYHKSNMHVLFSKNDIDQHLTQSVGEINEKIESYLKEESGKILLRLEIIFIESYIELMEVPIFLLPKNLPIQSVLSIQTIQIL